MLSTPIQHKSQATVRAVHRKMRRINSVAFVKQMRAKWGKMDAMARFRALLHEKVRLVFSFARSRLSQFIQAVTDWPNTHLPTATAPGRSGNRGRGAPARLSPL
jgi:hypothetical protein